MQSQGHVRGGRRSLGLGEHVALSGVLRGTEGCVSERMHKKEACLCKVYEGRRMYQRSRARSALADALLAPYAMQTTHFSHPGNGTFAHYSFQSFRQCGLSQP